MPPTISVPKGRATVTVREGSPAELQCEVRGKPRPPVLWSRVDKEAALLPSGLPVEETPDGKLRLERVSRDMSGTYRCQTARYNGFNVRPREAQVQLNVQCESHCPTDSLPSSLSLLFSPDLPPLYPFTRPVSPTPPPTLLPLNLPHLGTFLQTGKPSDRGVTSLSVQLMRGGAGRGGEPRSPGSRHQAPNPGLMLLLMTWG